MSRWTEIHIGTRVFVFGVALIDLHKARKTGHESITKRKTGEDIRDSYKISFRYCLRRLERKDDFFQRISTRDVTRFGLLFYNSNCDKSDSFSNSGTSCVLSWKSCFENRPSTPCSKNVRLKYLYDFFYMRLNLLGNTK